MHIRLGDYFMFNNRRRDRFKIIWWDRDGLAIFMKRLKSGTVQQPVCQADSKGLVIDQALLAIFFTGIDVTNIKRRKRFGSKSSSSSLSSQIRNERPVRS